MLYELPGYNHNRIWNLICGLLLLHNIVQDVKDATKNMVGWTRDVKALRGDANTIAGSMMEIDAEWQSGWKF